MTYKTKSFMTKKKAFTLIELLIVIAIIGILFIVLVSKVDFATDKAKATGVQTDFRSFQVAIESVAKENSGLATFGWDTGDTNGDRVRNSYDKGDINKNGVQDDGEVFVGSKTYGEAWTNVYTLTNPADADDKSAIAALEAAINKNLDPKLHITIADDLTVTMSNGAQDPWNTEYHGYYITNALNDGKDRGAIVIYSNGANQEFGSEHSIAGGVVTVNVPGNNVYGKDDYGMSVIYTYVNGYGEIKTTTSGFSVNQGGGQAGTEGTFVPGGSGGGNIDDVVTPQDPDTTELLDPGLYSAGAIELAKSGDVEAAQDMIKTSWDDLVAAGIVHVTNGVVYSNFNFDTWENASSGALDGDLVLPNDGSITSIGDAFYDEDYDNYVGNVGFGSCKNLTGIFIPKGVTSITDSAFYYCDGLTSITIPDSVTIIDAYAFSYCYELKAVHISSIESWCNISFIDGDSQPLYYAHNLYLNGELVTNLVIPDSLTSIGNYVFGGCESLINIIIPNNVTNIGDCAFSDCSSIKSMEIPDSVTSIGWGAFQDCYELSSITIPESVTNIGNWAFSSCTNLTDVTIPNSITSIGENVFSWCDSLTSVTIPDNVTSIGYCAFYSCDSLTSVTIGNGVTSIGDGVFRFCSELTSIIIPDNVTNIGYEAFDSCTKLMNITLPDSFTNINKDAFYNTGYYNNNANWENNVLYIGKYVIDAKTTISGAYTIKDGTLYVIDYAFWYCSKLTSVVMPDSVTIIGDYAFRYCEKLTNVVMSDNLASIGYCAFGGCTRLTSITIPNSVTNIDYSAFNDCKGLASITYNGTKDQWDSISKGGGWNVRVPATYVQCTDGQVTLEK